MKYNGDSVCMRLMSLYIYIYIYIYIPSTTVSVCAQNEIALHNKSCTKCVYLLVWHAVWYTSVGRDIWCSLSGQARYTYIWIYGIAHIARFEYMQCACSRVWVLECCFFFFGFFFFLFFLSVQFSTYLLSYDISLLSVYFQQTYGRVVYVRMSTMVFVLVELLSEKFGSFYNRNRENWKQ